MFSSGKAGAALAAAIVFLLLSSVAAYFAFARLRTSQLWVGHTRDVQHVLARFSSIAARSGRLRAEYVDSGDLSLIQRQADAVLELRNALASIQRLTADNVAQQANFAKLAELTERRIALMDQSLELKRTGRSTLEAQALISRQTVAVVDATEQVLESMDDEERRLLTERQNRENSSFTVAAGVLLTSLFLALVLFLIHHQLLTEQIRERQRAEFAQRALSARLLTLQDEERRKFARELHDSVGQQLVAMKMAIASLEVKLPDDPAVQDCFKLLDDTIAETRTISHLLHPPLLDEAGLNSAIRWFVEGFAKRSGIAVNLQIHDSAERLEEPTELVLFRALQESLTNVHRHSGAKQADVSLSTSGNNVILSVRDHGRGIPRAVLQSANGGGVGLAGMTERLREIGGQIEIHSNAVGTEIVARVPIRHRPPQPIIVPRAPQEVSG